MMYLCTISYLKGFSLLYFWLILTFQELHMYAPPFTIRVYDKRTFGQIPLVGSHTIKTLEDFEQLPPETKKIQRKPVLE